MIEEAFVSFDIAKRLKEKGFNEECFGYYNRDGQIDTTFGRWYNDAFIIGSYVAAPTQQMAMRWLREQKGIFIAINLTRDGKNYEIDIYKDGRFYAAAYEDMEFQTYELAVGFGLLYVLTEMDI